MKGKVVDKSSAGLGTILILIDGELKNIGRFWAHSIGLETGRPKTTQI